MSQRLTVPINYGSQKKKKTFLFPVLKYFRSFFRCPFITTLSRNFNHNYPFSLPYPGNEYFSVFFFFFFRFCDTQSNAKTLVAKFQFGILLNIINYNLNAKLQFFLDSKNNRIAALGMKKKNVGLYINNITYHIIIKTLFHRICNCILHSF